jgi:hypothetical protein
VGFVHNDFYPSEDPFHNIESFHQPRKMQTRRRAYPPASSGLRPSLFDFLRANYVLTMERFRRDRLRPSEPLEQVLAAEPVTEFDRDARPIVADQFRLFQALADKNGFHLIVLLFPIYPAVTSLADSPFPQNWLRGVLTAEGIDHLDLFETFRTRPDQRFMDWRHYTAEGNVVIADAIVRHLSSRRMLPGRDRGPLTECRADL